MVVRRLLIVVSVGLVVAAGVFLLNHRSNEAPDSVRQYPELEPGEKVPNSMFGNLGFPGSPPQFEFEGPFPQIPEKMLIYKIIPAKEFTPADARQLAQKYFNVPPDAEFHELSVYYSLKTRRHVFHLHPKTGFLSFDKLEEAMEKHSKDFPSDDECIRIATEYLESRGLLPDGAVLGGVTDNTSCGRMSVGFGRLINGYKSWGGVHVIFVGRKKPSL